MGRLPPNPQSAQAKRDAAEAKARAEMETNWLALRIVTLAWAEADAAEDQQAAADPAEPAQVEQKAAELADMVEVKLSQVEQPRPAKNTRKPAQLPTIARLHEALTYNCQTGEIRNRIDRGARAPAGKLAGSMGQHGYRSLFLDGQSLLCSRVAWAMHYGHWPRLEIGHRDGNRGNDAISNLIDAPRGIHHANSTKPNSDSDSPALGVRRRGHTKRLQAFYDGRHIGYFDTAEEAQRAVWKHKQELGVVYRPAEMLPIPANGCHNGGHPRTIQEA